MTRSADRLRTLVARSYRRVSLSRTRLADDHVLRAARKTMLRKSYCVMVTEGPSGSSARVVQPHAPDTDLTVHLGTSAVSRKAGEVARTGSAVLVYQDDARAACVVLHCDAEIVDLDPAGRARWFMTAWLAFWPRGSTDEDFVVIRCTPHAIEVWDAFRGVTPAPFGLESLRMVRTPSGWTTNPQGAQMDETTEQSDERYADRCRRSLSAEQARSLAETDAWAHVDKDRVHADWDVLYSEIAASLDDARPEDDATQALIERHFEIASRFYAPSREAYVGMGILYAEDAAMREFHNAYHPRMVEFLGPAMRVFADTRLPVPRQAATSTTRAS